MHPLWYTPILPLLFFVSAVGLGLAMVATESLATSWLYRRETEWDLLAGLTRAAAVVLSLFLVIRLGDLALRGKLHFLIEGSWASALFVVELLMSTIIPILLFTLPSARRRRGLLATGALMAVGGFILNRADVGGISHIPVTGQGYLPALTELSVSVGVVSGLALIFLFALERFPVWDEQPVTPDAFTPPLRDPITRSYFGGRWFSRTQMAGASWVVGVLLGIFLLETTTAEWTAPEPRPVRPARTVWAEKAPRANGPGNQFRLATEAVQVAPPAGEEALSTGPQPLLLIDGDRAGTFVLFEHKAHQQRLGQNASCEKCHHANLPLERGTPCVTCHRDMYRATDTYSHDQHVRVLGGNRSCARCHEDATEAKSRAASKPCVDCHKADLAQQTLVKAENDLPPGVAPGYRAAMHGLCVRCHVDHEKAEAVEKPYLGRCAACHRGHSPGGEELRLREGWSLNARLELP